MGRGPLLKTLRRKERALAKARVQGEEQARIEAWKKQPLSMKIYEFMKDKVDPFELAATIALTPIVKRGVDEIPNLVEWYEYLLAAGSPILGLLFVAGKAPDKIELNEPFKWLVAFGIAFLIVRHFDSFISAGGKVASFIGSLM